MKDISRFVSTGFWKDDKVLNDFSPEDKYFMLYLLTNPHTTQLGIYHLPIRVAAIELGYSVEAIMVLLDRFENKYDIIRYSKITNEIAIKNYLRYSVVKGGKPVFDCLKKEYDTIRDTELVSYVIDHLNSIDNKYLNITVREFIKYINNINNLSNDNDNERIVDDSSECVNHGRLSGFSPPTVDQVGEYCLERNNGIDPEEFVDYYSLIGWVVTKNKTPMKDWKAAVRNWERLRKKRNSENGSMYSDRPKYDEHGKLITEDNNELRDY